MVSTVSCWTLRSHYQELSWEQKPLTVDYYFLLIWLLLDNASNHNLAHQMWSLRDNTSNHNLAHQMQSLHDNASNHDLALLMWLLHNNASNHDLAVQNVITKW